MHICQIAVKFLPKSELLQNHSSPDDPFVSVRKPSLSSYTQRSLSFFCFQFYKINSNREQEKQTMHDKKEIELHWLMQTKYFWKIPIITKKEKEEEKRKDPMKFQREKCSGHECSYTKHDLHLHNNNQDPRGFKNSASKQG